MAAQVDIVLNAIDKTRGTLKGVGQEFKTLGGTVGLAVAAFYAANAALDGMEQRLNDLDMTGQANQINEAQQAWQALADTILVSVANSEVFAGVLKILGAAATTFSQALFINATLFEDLKAALGLQTQQEAMQKKIAMAQAYAVTQQKSQEANDKKRNENLKKQNDELQKQLDKYNSINDALDEGIAKRDPAAIRKAQGELAKFNAENPNFVSSGKGGVSVTIVGGGMKDVVTQVIIDGTKQDPNYLDPTRGY